MAILRFNSSLEPWGPMRHVQQEVERLMGRMFGGIRQFGGPAFPPINVLNGENDMIVDCELPGVKREDVELSVTGDTMVIKGSKKPPEGAEKLDYQMRERPVGEFTRTIVLPDRVDADRIDATVINGILTVRLAKSEAAKPKQIEVK